MLAIQPAKGGFDKRWISYCNEKNIAYKLVNCYNNDIINQLEDCSALMWQFYHAAPRDIKFAKQLLYSVQASGKKVFPDFNTMWHFDDKLGQKYLLEALGIPLVPTYVFYHKKEALEWSNSVRFPKVFKLRSGAGSANVKLVKTKEEAQNLIRKAFGKGFNNYDAMGSLKERWRKWRLGKNTVLDVAKGLIRFAYPPSYVKAMGKEIGYVYFQDFIPDNDHDIRVVVIDNKAFAIKRLVRKNDFRASGGGDILYEKSLFSEKDIHLAFEIHNSLKSQCTAMDFVYDNGQAKIVEVSYGFSPEGYDDCPGYWDKNLKWHGGKFNPYGWMVEELLKAK